MSSVQIEKTDLSDRFPEWFRPESGFRFTDADGDLCLVIGWGGWRSLGYTTVETPFGCLSGFKLEMKPCTLLFACLYKGEWRLSDLGEADVADGKPGWDPNKLAEVSGWR